MIRTVWFAARLCLALGVAAGVQAQSRAQLKPEDLYAAVLQSTLTIEVENAAGRHFVGTGFLAVGEGLAVTAWHVVQDARRVEVRFSDHQQAKVLGLVDKDERADIALLKLDTAIQGGATRLAARPRIPLGVATPRIGSRIYVVGAPRGYEFSISDGLLSQIRTVDGVGYFQVSCPISPGDSGGPVLNDRGEAIGIMSWRKPDAESVSFAIPAADIARLRGTRPPVPWPTELLVAAPQRARAAAPQVRAPLTGAEPVLDGYGAFQKLLSARAGRQLTVVVRDGREETTFRFEAPKPAP